MTVLNFVCDVEADGPCPGLYSMVSFGFVNLEDQTKTFYGKTKPITDTYIRDALAISKITREEHQQYPGPIKEMNRLAEWLDSFHAKRMIFWSDNPAFDWQFINYYFHLAIGGNPFGFSARRIGDLYAGYKLDPFDHTSWKKLRDTKHTHNPVDDAKGNAEALSKILKAIRKEANNV